VLSHRNIPLISWLARVRGCAALIGSLLLGVVPVGADGLDDGVTPAAIVQPARFELAIDKGARTLSVTEDGRVVKTYRISWGRGGEGDKLMEGDKRTPVGTYRIVDFNEASRFELFMHLNYPNVKDAFFGLKNGVITRDEFDAIIEALRNRRAPPQDTRLGGAIGIHGLGPADARKLQIHKAMNWTEGCIAMTNDEIYDLRRYVDIGTKVVIRE